MLTVVLLCLLFLVPQSRDPHKASAVFDSFSNFIFTFNEGEEQVLKIERGERRFVHFQVSSQQLQIPQEQKFAYFTRLVNADTRAFTRYILSVEPLRRGETYLSDATFQAKVDNLGSFEQWWYGCLKQGAIVFAKKNHAKDVFSWLELAHLRDLSRAVKVEVYACYCESAGAKKLLNTLFWKQMALFDCGNTDARKDGARMVSFNTLAQLRSAFCARMGAHLPWFNTIADQAIAAAAALTEEECARNPQAIAPIGGVVDVVASLPSDEEMMKALGGEAPLPPMARSAAFDYSSGSSDAEMSDDDEEKVSDESIAALQDLVLDTADGEKQLRRMEMQTAIVEEDE